MLTGCFSYFSIQQRPCFTARFALKRRVFCSLGSGVHSGQVQLWFACRCLHCVFLDEFWFWIKTSDSEFWLTFTSFVFCFLCPSFTVTHGSVLSNYPWIQWAGMDLHLLVKSEGLIKRDSISAVTFPWCYPCSLLYPHCDFGFAMYWWLLLLLNNVKLVLKRLKMLQL